MRVETSRRSVTVVCEMLSRRALINGGRRSLLAAHSFTKSRLASSSDGSQYSSLRPLESNIRRILRKEIENRLDYAPPHQPLTNFEGFTVEDRPGEKWITLKSKTDNENIKIEAIMFDGSAIAPQQSGDCRSEDIRLHISVLIDIRKEEGTDFMEFICSAWPDSLEIQQVYIVSHDKFPAQSYLGPDVKNLSNELQKSFSMFLNARGLNDGLSKFLHAYMINKDKAELLNWLENVQSYYEV